MPYVSRSRLYYLARDHALSELRERHRIEYEELLELHLSEEAERLGFEGEVRVPNRPSGMARLSLVKGSG